MGIRTASLLSVAWVSLLFTADAFAEPVLAVPTGTPKVVSFKFDKINKNPYNIPNRNRQRHRKREEQTIVQLLDNADYLYYANISIGTPPQDLRLHIDTGSSDIWVQSSESEFCQAASQPCAVTGIYDRGASSTYDFVSKDFHIAYADKEYSIGDYGRETFTVGNARVRDLQFGIGLNTTSSEGIMGIGYNTNEVQVDWLGKEPYPNLVDLMVEQGHIQSRAYSLWLNDLDAKVGEILFGGIDTAKYKGGLHTIPILIRDGKTEAGEFLIALTSMGLTNDDGEHKELTNAKFGIPVLLDSGTTYTYLPRQLFNRIAEEVGIEYTSGASIAPCELRNYNGSIDFGFSGYQVHVPFNEMIIDAYDIYGERITYSTGDPVCFFGIFPEEGTASSSYVLGDTFLRSAYIVYDLDNAEVSLANVHFNVTNSKILEIGAGKDSVPDATGVENPITLSVSGGRRPHTTVQFTDSVLPSETGKSMANLVTPLSGSLLATWIFLWSFLV